MYTIWRMWAKESDRLKSLPDGVHVFKPLTPVTKAPYGCTDQRFALSRDTLLYHGKLFIEHNILGRLQQCSFTLAKVGVAHQCVCVVQVCV